MLNIAWDVLALKIIQGLTEIQILLGILYFVSKHRWDLQKKSHWENEEANQRWVQWEPS